MKEGDGMYLLLIILHKEEYLSNVLSCLIELGIEDAVIVDSESLGRALAYKVPLFAGIRFNLEGNPYSKLILAITDTREIGERLVLFLKEVDIDLEEEGVSRILTIEIDSVLGTPEKIAGI